MTAAAAAAGDAVRCYRTTYWPADAYNAYADVLSVVSKGTSVKRRALCILQD